MEFKDKNYDEVYVGAEVEIPSPNEEDLWNHEFTATVRKLDKVSGYIEVEDGDGDWWTVEVERVELT